MSQIRLYGEKLMFLKLAWPGKNTWTATRALCYPVLGPYRANPKNTLHIIFFPKLWMLPLEHQKVQFHQMICERGHAGVTSSTKFSII